MKKKLHRPSLKPNGCCVWISAEFVSFRAICKNVFLCVLRTKKNSQIDRQTKKEDLKKKVAQDTPRTNENVGVNQFVKTAFWGVFLRTTRQTNRKVRISFIRGTFSRWLYSNFFRCIILGYLSNNLFKEEEISLFGTFFLWYLLYINHCISDYWKIRISFILDTFSRWLLFSFFFRGIILGLLK